MTFIPKVTRVKSQDLPHNWSQLQYHTRQTDTHEVDHVRPQYSQALHILGLHFAMLHGENFMETLLHLV